MRTHSPPAAKRRIARRSPQRSPGTVAASSDDGIVSFILTPCASGVYVERTRLRSGAGRIVQAMQFADGDSFLRWCASDLMQFAYPLLFVTLRRSGSALFHAAE